MNTETVQAIKPRPLGLIRGEGRQLGGAPVASVDSFGLCEDGKTLAVTIELTDGRVAMFQFCPGLPVTACIVGDATAYR